MSWIVIKENSDGKKISKLSEEFFLSENDILYSADFRVIKYLDPYGDTTFNSLMFDDLITDMTNLKKQRVKSADLIDKIISLATECKKEVHTYLKFYGD